MRRTQYPVDTHDAAVDLVDHIEQKRPLTSRTSDTKHPAARSAFFDNLHRYAVPNEGDIGEMFRASDDARFVLMAIQMVECVA
ncbi:hypothetical protein WT27_13765 [Burkholderia territorii]|uniref:Uncharacterized protein n=1 Tax=Burkholderia territorii TaxID=1503055 RepID=A0A105V4B2_9BURK|nr:hypothetical protein WT27_13765 [Burkholderia territorii]KVX33928.1 hypothetical protein WT31_09670 [Burkholderia territorii]